MLRRKQPRRSSGSYKPSTASLRRCPSQLTGSAPLQLRQHERLIRPPFEDHPARAEQVAESGLMFPSSPTSLAETYTPSSGIRCRRHACALQIVPSGCVFQVGTISLPPGATMRLRSPRRRGAHQHRQ